MRPELTDGPPMVPDTVALPEEKDTLLPGSGD
jgi:hypothetical protein